MLDLVAENSALRVQIFSGSEAGNLARALAGETLGTVIKA